MTTKKIRLKRLLKKAHKAINAYAMDSSLINWQRQLRATKLYNIAHTHLTL